MFYYTSLHLTMHACIPCFVFWIWIQIDGMSCTSLCLHPQALGNFLLALICRPCPLPQAWYNIQFSPVNLSVVRHVKVIQPMRSPSPIHHCFKHSTSHEFRFALMTSPFARFSKGSVPRLANTHLSRLCGGAPSSQIAM